jgi:hypothetical protein
VVALTRRALLTLFLICWTTPAAAQTAPVFLEPGHWAYEAIRGLNRAGVAPQASDPALATVTLEHARAVFAHAAVHAEEDGRTALAAQALAYLRLLSLHGDTAGLLAGAAVRAGWAAAGGEALGGDGYYVDEDWQGSRPVGRSSEPAAALRAHGYVRPWLSWSVDAGRLGGEWRVPAATAGVRLGSFDAWAGRRRLHYGIGNGGGTVIGGGLHDVPDLAHRTMYTFEGGGIQVRDPFRIPYLHFLGPVRVEVAGGQLPRNGLVERPYVVFGRMVGMPFSPRFTLGINRGAIFGGEGNPITAGRLLGLLAGMHGGEHGEFENQVFSVVMRYRPPLGRLPIEAYLEWGMDDTAGAVKNAPAVIAGLEVGPLSDRGPFSAGLEYARYPRSCCGQPIWYRSVFFRGSWADEGRLFAHPLGGHGTELLAHARIDLPGRGVLVGASAFMRDRGEENLFAPDRRSRSLGGTASVEHPLATRTSVRFNGSVELARQWDTFRFTMMVAHTFTQGNR